MLGVRRGGASAGERGDVVTRSGGTRGRGRLARTVPAATLAVHVSLPAVALWVFGWIGLFVGFALSAMVSVSRWP